MGALFFIIYYFLACIVVGVLANDKGYSGVGSFFLSIIFTPVFGLLVLLVECQKGKDKK